MSKQGPPILDVWVSKKYEKLTLLLTFRKMLGCFHYQHNVIYHVRKRIRPSCDYICRCIANDYPKLFAGFPMMDWACLGYLLFYLIHIVPCKKQDLANVVCHDLHILDDCAFLCKKHDDIRFILLVRYTTTFLRKTEYQACMVLRIDPADTLFRFTHGLALWSRLTV